MAGHELTDRQAAVLLQATREAMGNAGAMGGSIGAPFGSLGAEAGGRAGGRFGARLTRPRSAEAVVEVATDPETARGRARALIAERGTEIDDPDGRGDGAVWGLVASGSFGMMPALVRVAVEAAPGGARVHVRATGREGLIRQRIAQGAVDRLCAAVRGEPQP